MIPPWGAILSLMYGLTVVLLVLNTGRLLQLCEVGDGDVSPLICQFSFWLP